MSFPKYEHYKDSGVEWLGEVPAHWDVTRLKFVASVQTGMAKGKEYGDKETLVVPYLRVANVQDGYLALDDMATMEIPAAELDRYRLQPGDVLMNEGGDFDKLGRGHVWQGEIEPCIHQNHVFAVRPIGVLPRWLNTYTGSNAAQFYFMTRSKQSTNLASISSTNIMELPLPAPSAQEQELILSFLERETTKLYTLITEQRTLIDLLKEKRQAVISHAVTKGLDPRVPMKDSGVEWLGEVPVHWEIKKISHVADLMTGHPFPSEKFEFNPDSGIKLVRGDNVTEGYLRWGEKGRYWPFDLEYEKRYELAINDIVVQMDGSKVGKNWALLGKEDLPALLVQRITRVRAAGHLLPEFIYAQISSQAFVKYIDQAKTDPAIPHITMKNIGDYWITSPPVSEQRTISIFVATETKKIDALTAEAETTIALLQERRSALISAAVTGKIDVRQAA